MVQLFVKIKKADFVYPAWFSIEVKMLLNQVLVVDPRKRLTLTQVLPHRNSFSTAIIHIFYIYNDWS